MHGNRTESACTCPIPGTVPAIGQGVVTNPQMVLFKIERIRADSISIQPLESVR